MNHLRVVFGDVFGLFWVFGWISGKMDKISKSGNFGVLGLSVGIPRSSVGPRQGVACPRRGAAERRLGQALGYTSVKAYVAK